MPRFSSAPIDEVAPKQKPKQPSQRAQIQQQYRTALHDAVIDNGRALIVELESDDKPLTIRNRIKRAAHTLNLEYVVIRRRRDRIIAYQSRSSDTEE